MYMYAVKTSLFLMGSEGEYKATGIAMNANGIRAIRRLSNTMLWLYDTAEHAKEAKTAFENAHISCGDRIEYYFVTNNIFQYVGYI